MLKPSESATDALSIDTGVTERLLGGFIRDEVQKAGFSEVVVGASGGVDSSLVVALACRSLGAEHVHAVSMPYRTSSADSVEDARAVCAQYDIEPEVIDISPQIDSYFERFADADRTRRGNKMARERMTILYDRSLVWDALVLGTSNKTELLLGYGTLFGDMASALNPIGDLYKTQVYSMAAALDLPERVQQKAPSADLFEGQSDEADLGLTYAIIDVILFHIIDERRPRSEVVAMGFDETVVDSVMRRVRLSQYKRRLPVIAKLSQRTIDRDFRYPRDWGL
ncbi:MAG: NAD+ synthase [Candidatus Dormibacteraeota bacterium]|nr:NAD+ synthase [Candidatus Dormibacteraeota bacterium]